MGAPRAISPIEKYAPGPGPAPRALEPGVRRAPSVIRRRDEDDLEETRESRALEGKIALLELLVPRVSDRLRSVLDNARRRDFASVLRVLDRVADDVATMLEKVDTES